MKNLSVSRFFVKVIFSVLIGFLTVGTPGAQAQPVAGTAASNSEICSGSSASMTLTGFSGSIQWQQSADGTTNWTNVTGGTGANSASYLTENLITTTYYRAEITQTGFSSVYSNIIMVSVNPLPASAGVIGGLTTVDQGQDAVSYIVPTIANATSYLWTLPAGAYGLSSGKSITVNFSKTSVSGNIAVQGINSCGNGAESVLAITVNPKTYICDAQFNYSWDGTAHFTDLSTGNPIMRAWDFGDGTFSVDKNPNHDYAKDGSYMVTLSIFNLENNCISSVTKEVIIGSGTICKSDFDAVINPATGIANFVTKSSTATDFFWDFGDGEYSISANPEHTYKKGGFYPVCLTTGDSNTGCQSVSCKSIIYIPAVGNFIQADFSFFADHFTNTVIFLDLSTPNTTNWYWTMGDGKVSSTKNPLYLYEKAGLYNVCLTAFDENNSLSNSICKEVRVGEPGCNLASDFAYFINPLNREATFLNLSAGSVTDYFWTFGDGSSSTLKNPNHQYSTAGHYEVKLSVRNSLDSCMDEYSQFIEAGSTDCRAGFTFGADQDINTVYFEDDSKGEIDNYYWDFGDGSFSVQQNPNKLYSKAGIYIVGQTVIDNSSGCVDFTFQPVQLGTVDCSADFITYIDSSVHTAYFTNRVLGKSSALLWSFGDGSFSTEQNPSHTFPGNGIYSTGLNTYNLANGCMDYFEDLLLIGDLGIDCNADFAYLADPAIPQVQFSNKSMGDIVSSAWNFGEYGSDNSDELNPSFSYKKGGYYNVCLTVTNSSGISNMTCKWVLVQATTTNDCRANFMYTMDSTTRKVTFADNSFGEINKYSWDFGDNSTNSFSTDKNPIHTYDNKGYYMVQLTVEDSVSGCVSNEYKLLNVADEQVLKAAFGYESKLPDKKFAGYPVDLVSASSGDGATVEWDFGDKQIKKEFKYVMDSTSRIVTHYYAKPGRYEVCLRISDPVSDRSDVYCSFVYTKNDIGIDQVMKSDINLSIYPNPLIDYTTINYTLEKSQFIEISIYDQLGRKIETLVKSRQDSDNYQIKWDTKTLTTGVYHLKMITSEGIITKQLVIAK